MMRIWTATGMTIIFGCTLSGRRNQDRPKESKMTGRN